MLPRSLRLALYFVVGLMLGTSLTLAHAGYALPSPPPGFSVTSAGSMYRAPAGVTAVNGAFSSGVSLNVAGKAINVPASMRFAANAPNYVVGAMRSKVPWAVVGAFAVWAATEGIIWSSQDEKWMVPAAYDPVACPSCGVMSLQVCPGASTFDAMQPTVYCRNGAPSTGMWLWGLVDTAQKNYLVGKGWQWTNNMGGKHRVMSPVFYGSSSLGNREATDTDWAPLQASSPDAVLNEAVKHIALPVNQPQLQTVVHPLSDPYIDPVTGLPYRDMVRVTPSPTTESPFRVRIDPYREPMSSVDPDAEPVTPTEQSPVESIPDENPGLCEQFPDASACAKLGSGSDLGSVEVQAVDVTAIQPVSIGSTGGTCPADRVMQTQFGAIAFEWATLCAFAEGVRPVILAMAWLVAGFGFFYGAKRSQ